MIGGIGAASSPLRGSHPTLPAQNSTLTVTQLFSVSVSVPPATTIKRSLCFFFLSIVSSLGFSLYVFAVGLENIPFYYRHQEKQAEWMELRR